MTDEENAFIIKRLEKILNYAHIVRFEKTSKDFDSKIQKLILDIDQLMSAIIEL